MAITFKTCGGIEFKLRFNYFRNKSVYKIHIQAVQQILISHFRFNEKSGHVIVTENGIQHVRIWRADNYRLVVGCLSVTLDTASRMYRTLCVEILGF